MILLGSVLNSASIFSIQTSGEVARAVNPVVNPADLRILAYEISSPLISEKPRVMLLSDVRELSNLGFIVDDIDQFVDPQEILKLKDIYDLHFTLIGKTVIDEKHHKLGKIIDYTIDTDQFLIIQLTVKRPLFKSFNDTELLIHRSQITEVNNDSIVVHSEIETPEPELREVVGSYVNPFRKPKEAQGVDLQQN